ncbi:peptidase S24/S26A/S26B/S26C, partial [Dimargaris cristalligena]
GPSMLPTLHVQGDWLAYDRISHRMGWLKPGDVVLCVSPSDPNRLICKRLLGMPGDRIIHDPRKSDSPTIEVPPGHIWIQGDNMGYSIDSRLYGPLPMGLLFGKVWAIVSF